MRRVLFFAAVSLSAAAAPVLAASLSLNFTNMSGDTINELIATSKGAAEVSIQNILAAPIVNGESGVATLDAAEGNCVFNLTFTFASGKILERPDTDLCQSDTIVIE
jgi:hypothetical protein